MSATFGQKLKTAREESRLSQLQVGVALQVSDKTVSGYESDRIIPPVEKMLKLADLLKKPISFFIGTDTKDYKISSRLRAVEVMLRDIRQELREIKTLAQKYGIDE
jgi:transcriptional regulator with XRE-family HTH domain